MIEIKVDTRMVMDALQRLQHATGDMSPAMDKIGNAIKEQVRSMFDNNAADPYGVPWKQLKNPSKRRGTNTQMLRDKTNNLANLWSHSFDSNSTTVGTNVVYAAIHQFGGSVNKQARSQVNAHMSEKDGRFRSRKSAEKLRRYVKISFSNIGSHVVNIPARPFLPDERGMPESYNRIITEVISRHLQKAIR